MKIFFLILAFAVPGIVISVSFAPVFRIVSSVFWQKIISVFVSYAVLPGLKKESNLISSILQLTLMFTGTATIILIKSVSY